MVIVCWPLRSVYVKTGRDIKRLDATSEFRVPTSNNVLIGPIHFEISAQSPLYSHITTTFEGLTTLRAFRLEKKFEDQNMRYMSDAVSCRFLTLITTQAIGFAMDVFALVYVCAITILLVALPAGSKCSNQGSMFAN